MIRRQPRHTVLLRCEILKHQTSTERRSPRSSTTGARRRPDPLCIDTGRPGGGRAVAQARACTIVNHSRLFGSYARRRQRSRAAIAASARARRAPLGQILAGSHAETHWSGTFVERRRGEIHDSALADEANIVSLAGGHGDLRVR